MVELKVSITTTSMPLARVNVIRVFYPDMSTLNGVINTFTTFSTTRCARRGTWSNRLLTLLTPWSLTRRLVAFMYRNSSDPVIARNRTRKTVVYMVLGVLIFR